jgi:hypothetical protein
VFAAVFPFDFSVSGYKGDTATVAVGAKKSVPVLRGRVRKRDYRREAESG